MLKLRDFWFVISISLIVLVFVSFPYVLAEITGGTGFVFNGFLLNPFDGNTYLAKMYQGWQGSWRFKLPYTADPGEGAYLFIFYLGLGHLARFLHLSNIIVFHSTRVLGSVFLLWMLWRYFGELFLASRPRKFAFSLAVLGSGIGWLFVAAGELTSDFWVAEAYPFLSAYANPHFPISLALMLWLLLPPLNQPLRSWQYAAKGFGGLLLGGISPFSVVIVLMVLGGELFLGLLQKRWLQSVFWRIFCIALMGLPLMIYDLWAVAVDPILAGWNDQNLTPSPLVWDLLISLSPALVLASIGIWGVIRGRKQVKIAELEYQNNWSSLLIWVGLSLVLMYLPWSLQRRFMIGIYIPLAGLSAIGMEILSQGKMRLYRFLAIVVFFLAIPTNVFVLLAGFQAIRTHDPQIYLTRAEQKGFLWIEENTPTSDLVLSSPEMGLFIPAYTGRRVIYGHPFETVDAQNQKTNVIYFFSGGMSEAQMQNYIYDHGVNFIFVGPRENALGLISIPDSWEFVFRVDDVTIYIPDQP